MKKTTLHKAKISKALAGIPKTDEHRAALQGSHADRKRLTCPHCDKVIAINVAHRWHFDKCKHK